MKSIYNLIKKVALFECELCRDAGEDCVYEHDKLRAVKDEKVIIYICEDCFNEGGYEGNWLELPTILEDWTGVKTS